MTKVIPYLNFNGNCREAMIFYKECLGGDLSLQKISESPMAAQMPSEMGARILHSQLTKNEFILRGSDMMGQNIKNGNVIGLCLDCTDEQATHLFFSNLSAGGQIVTPLHQTFWGATYGEITDKFGINWLFNHTKS